MFVYSFEIIEQKNISSVVNQQFKKKCNYFLQKI